MVASAAGRRRLVVLRLVAGTLALALPGDSLDLDAAAAAAAARSARAAAAPSGGRSLQDDDPCPPLRRKWCRRTDGLANLVDNPGFEDALSPWYANYGAENVQLDSDEKRSGSSSVYSSDRSSAWNGPQQDMMGKMEPNRTYAISAWAKLAGLIAPSDDVLLTIRIGDDGAYKWRNFGNVVDSSGWTQVAGELTVDVAGTLTSLELYAEGPRAGEAFWVDDVV
ncbi:hypothetical protein ACHAWF_013641, partial [Thalassiosira exigua]